MRIPFGPATLKSSQKTCRKMPNPSPSPKLIKLSPTNHWPRSLSFLIKNCLLSIPAWKEFNPSPKKYTQFNSRSTILQSTNQSKKTPRSTASQLSLAKSKASSSSSTHKPKSLNNPKPSSKSTNCPIQSATLAAQSIWLTRKITSRSTLKSHLQLRRDHSRRKALSSKSLGTTKCFTFRTRLVFSWHRSSCPNKRTTFLLTVQLSTSHNAAITASSFARGCYKFTQHVLLN